MCRSGFVALFLLLTLPLNAQHLTIGGYGEAAYTRNFFSDNVYRYSRPSEYANDPSHGRFDIPHAVIYLGYDFGKGWSMQTEIEFEHTGTGSAVEKEFTEAGEWESEIEKGGELELEQFWIQKSFRPEFNVRAGHIVVPVGGLNYAHEPLNYFTVSRPDRPYLYTTVAWATAMSQNKDVIAAIRAEGAGSPYYVDVDKDGTVTDAEISEAVLALLSPKTNQFDNAYHNFEPEMTADEYYDFMVWHRGLAIPRARNLNDPNVQKGKKLFTDMGCASCHRPSWTTGDDNYWTPAMNGTKPLPRYANQTIWPYSDFIQHRLWMKNDIHGTWCRTTPLWGRGLSALNTGRSDRLHDCRARNVVEAIMWHGFSKESDAYSSAEKFYNLSKEERDAVVKFIDSI